MMDALTKLSIAELLKEAAHAADARTNGLLDRDELAAIIRQLITTTQTLLREFDQAGTPRADVWSKHSPLALNQSLPV
jgi:hypothetical protein